MVWMCGSTIIIISLKITYISVHNYILIINKLKYNTLILTSAREMVDTLKNISSLSSLSRT